MTGVCGYTILLPGSLHQGEANELADMICARRDMDRVSDKAIVAARVARLLDELDRDLN